MKAKKLIKDKTIEFWRFSATYIAFHERNKIIYSSPDFERTPLTAKEKGEYKKYWSGVSKLTNIKTVEIAKSTSGVFDKRIVPEEFLPLYIAPILNKDKRVYFLENKSIYNKWFGREVFPKDCFHKIDNKYFTCEFDVIEDIERSIDDTLCEADFPIVVKPNKDSYGGKDIYFVNSKGELKEVISQFEDLVVQEKLEQSELIDVFNDESINTVRVCIYKDNEGNYHIINANIRMGVSGSLDNLSDGGIVCNIKSDGTLNDYAHDRYAKKFFKHPNSNFVFKDREFPLYKQMIDESIQVAKDIIGARLISLDMALDSTNRWRCIEVNLDGQTMLFAQFAGEPFLGKHTDEVINLIACAKN